MRKHQTVLVVAVATVLGLSLGGGMAQMRQRTTNVFMRQKLDYAQGVLEGITLERYELVVTNATSLRNMSMTNVYLTLGNQDYAHAITNFQSAVDNLISAAKKRDQVATTGDYAAMVQSCVQCHKQFRREQAFPVVK